MLRQQPGSCLQTFALQLPARFLFHRAVTRLRKVCRVSHDVPASAAAWPHQEHPQGPAAFTELLVFRPLPEPLLNQLQTAGDMLVARVVRAVQRRMGKPWGYGKGRRK